MSWWHGGMCWRGAELLPRLAVGPELLRVLAQGGDQLVLAHRRAALDLQVPSALAQLLDAALLIGAPVRCALLLGRLTLGRSALGRASLAMVAEGDDQLVLAHRGAQDRK